jgi:hypothetical protein
MLKYVFISTLFLSVSVFAQDNNQVSTLLSSDLSNVSKNETVSASPTEIKTEFLKSSELFGNLRYRQQYVKTGVNEDRPVQRMMFRVGHHIQVQDDLKLTYRLMTGTSNVSGNNTLGDQKTPMAPRQSIGLDQAFANYTPIKDLKLFIGKMPQFFATAGKNQIILDSDIALEGFGLQYSTGIGDQFNVALNGGSFVVREKYDNTFGTDLTDSNLNIAQIVLSAETNNFKVNLGHGIYSYTGVKNEEPGFYSVGATNSAKGNTLDLLQHFQWQYEIIENLIEVNWSPKNFKVSVFAGNITNTAADTLNSAQAYGASLSWKKVTVSYINQKIESDAVLAFYTDSDFSDGQTDSEGSILSITYKFNKNASMGYSEYQNKQAVSTLPVDYRRRHIDLMFTF